MDIQNKCCGNCKHFKSEDVSGKGWCEEQSWVTECSKVCKCHEPDLNGWTEITPDNVDEVYNIDQNRVVVQYTKNYCFPIIRMVRDFSATISTMAKQGGYYYYVLPELKI